MDIALGALVFWPALAIGSFLNVVAGRLPEHRSLVSPGSHCEQCNVPLAWYDNVPVVSYVLLRGKCRHCGARYGLHYLVVELGTALLIAACFAKFGLSGEAFVSAFFVACLVVITVIDLERRIIPNAIVLPATGIVLVAQILLFPDQALEWILAALAAAAFLFIAVLVNPRGMGLGDVKLALLMGAMLGKSVGVAMMVALLTALIPAIFLLARDGSAARKTRIPFGPFLALGSLVALFAGDELLSRYLDLF